MPDADGLTPGEMQIITDLLNQAYPGNALISIDRPVLPPRPPEPAERALPAGDVPFSPSLADLQAHYRKLGFRRLTQPDPGVRPALTLDDLVRARISIPGQGEREVRISLTDRAIVQP